ncbi:MAG: IS256 family transposase [Candidatus Melainabacteria bacterium]|jgi:putative transposase|nr:IS256 family transposase [Candidatus Melainabacteria bacterium]
MTPKTKKRDLLDELIREHLAEGKHPKELLEEGGLLKQLTQELVQKCLEAEMDTHLGYEKNERAGKSAENRRNGYTKKVLKSEQGEVTLGVPRDRNGEFEPLVVAKHQTRLAGLDSKVIALYARGMTVRDIQAQLEEMYGVEISPTLISNVTNAVMDDVKAWQSRPLDAVYPIMWIDALQVKIRHDNRVVNKAVHLVLAVTEAGQKELLGIWIAEHEGAKFWLSVFSELKNRGVKDVLIACADGLAGIDEALVAAFPEVMVQTCIVHMVRNSTKYVSYKDRKELCADLKNIYQAIDEKQGLDALDVFCTKWDKKYSMIGKSWRHHWDKIIPMYLFPEQIRRTIYTTNAIESMNMTLRKASRNHRIFPDDASAIKVLYLAAGNIAKKWTMPIRNWGEARNWLAIEFKGRLPLD